MADLSRRDRRGQILLVAGFAIAVLFVALALILNSIVYAENLATRSESTASEPILHSNAIGSGTSELVTYINTHNTTNATSYGELRENLTTGFSAISRGFARNHLQSGRVTDDEIENQFNGTWLTQTNTSRNFTNTTAESEWTLGDNLSGARALRIQVTDTFDPDSPFTVTAQDSTNTWQLTINGSAVSVTDANNTTKACTGSWTEPFWVNVSQGRVASTPCPDLDFGGGLDTIQTIRFQNADAINGTYRVLVNKTASNIDSTHYGPTSGPHTLRGIFGVVVGIDYERPQLRYQTNIQVIPGENDE